MRLKQEILQHCRALTMVHDSLIQSTFLDVVHLIFQKQPSSATSCFFLNWTVDNKEIVTKKYTVRM